MVSDKTKKEPLKCPFCDVPCPYEHCSYARPGDGRKSFHELAKKTQRRANKPENGREGGKGE